ncbi:hypothetical protein AK812_SmicGene42303 [Symbiodinium microadriaticum]|uniref:Uncharacterized protein n=1 Tax=Symbiodinium microadriaticum TaxID=2951 RepID=A0A1Q9C3X0_SYMMI|nr:hypothetical protein AK812_SmicGene42303 [Symbiodinium microadriaticum]
MCQGVSPPASGEYLLLRKWSISYPPPCLSILWCSQNLLRTVCPLRHCEAEHGVFRMEDLSSLLGRRLELSAEWLAEEVLPAREKVTDLLCQRRMLHALALEICIWEPSRPYHPPSMGLGVIAIPVMFVLGEPGAGLLTLSSAGSEPAAAQPLFR